MDFLDKNGLMRLWQHIIARLENAENSGAISTHNTATNAHNDIRLLIDDLTTRLNTLIDSDDTTLDQISEIVAYIKSNKSLIESITTNKVNVSDIDDTLSIAGKVADAKAVGDAISEIQSYFLNIDYDAILAFDTSEVIFGTNTSSVLGQAILGQMVLA